MVISDSLLHVIIIIIILHKTQFLLKVYYAYVFLYFYTTEMVTYNTTLLTDSGKSVVLLFWPRLSAV